MMALGAIQYLQESGNTAVLVGAYDALEEAKAAIQSGQLAVTIDQQAARQGYLGVQYAVQSLNGEEVPAETLVEVLLVTAETLE
jgi:ribose transport system substrate-binding protein